LLDLYYLKSAPQLNCREAMYERIVYFDFIVTVIYTLQHEACFLGYWCKSVCVCVCVCVCVGVKMLHSVYQHLYTLILHSLKNL